MDENTASIELKFEGNNIRPAVVKASEVAELIKSFEGALEAVIRESHPEIKEGFVLISFDQIKHESLSIKCIAHKAKEYVLPAYIAITTAFSTNDFNNLPFSSIEELRTITRFSRKYLCDGAFISDGNRVANFNTETDVSYSKNNVARGDTTLYGEVLKAGGETPRVQIKINNDYTISFEVKKEIAIYLATKLYQEIGLKGNARWNTQSFKILDFKAESVIDVPKGDLRNSFKELNKLFGEHINGDISSFLA